MEEREQGSAREQAGVSSRLGTACAAAAASTLSFNHDDDLLTTLSASLAYEIDVADNSPLKYGRGGGIVSLPSFARQWRRDGVPGVQQCGRSPGYAAILEEGPLYVTREAYILSGRLPCAHLHHLLDYILGGSHSSGDGPRLPFNLQQHLVWARDNLGGALHD